MLMVIGSKQLFDSKDHTALQFFNEMNVFLLTGLCIGFTNITYNGNAEVAKVITFVFMVDIPLVVAVNTLFTLHSCIFGALHFHRVNRRERAIGDWKEELEYKRINLKNSMLIRNPHKIIKQEYEEELNESARQLNSSRQVESTRNLLPNLVGLPKVTENDFEDISSSEYESDSSSSDQEAEVVSTVKPNLVNQIEL
jgi:hypothetical protein